MTDYDKELDAILYEALYEFGDVAWDMGFDDIEKGFQDKLGEHQATAKAKLSALLRRVELGARRSELEMFKKIEVMDMSKPVTEHISRRFKELEAGL